GFREPQTALVVSSILKTGNWFWYEIPVLGPPWRLPFEFPLYQWVIVIFVKLFGMEVIPAGRLVSILFFVGGLFPAASLLKEIGFKEGRTRLVFLTLLVSAPIYVEFSRTFLIESTGLFLGLCYLANVAKYLSSRESGSIILAGFFGVIGALVKVTTFYGFF